jgi:hypothetical protein
MFTKSTAIGCLRQAKDGNDILAVLDMIADEMKSADSDSNAKYQELTDISIL